MSKTDRIVEILLILSKNPGVTAPELAQKLQVTERSVYRYLAELKEKGYLIRNIKDTDSASRKYYLTPLSFTGAEALAMISSGKAFISQEGLPLCQDLKTALEKVEAAIFAVEDKRMFCHLQARFTYLSNKMRDYSPWEDKITIINKAIRRSRSITIVYDSFSSGEVRERIIDPYDLYWSDGNLYLAAFCHKNKKMRTFRIDRFKAIKEIGDRFNRCPEFNLNDFLSSSWRVYRGGEEIKVKLLVYPPATRLFQESSYHDSQKLQKLQDGKMHCFLTVPNTPEFRSWLLGWGKQVEVVEPLPLREEIRKELQESLGRYGG